MRLKVHFYMISIFDKVIFQFEKYLMEVNITLWWIVHFVAFEKNIILEAIVKQPWKRGVRKTLALEFVFSKFLGYQVAT